jgi:hypothetical protein
VAAPKLIKSARHKDSKGTCMMSRPPSPGPSEGYALVGPNERCLEAEVTPLRRLTDGELERRGLIIGPNPTYPTKQDCYECKKESNGLKSLWHA